MTGGAHDAELIAKLERGDVAAAQEIYTLHVRTLLRFGVAMTNSTVLAEDIAHDSFIELMRRPGKFRPQHGSLRAYLLGIARHQVSRHLRATRRYVSGAWDSSDDQGVVAIQAMPQVSESSVAAGTEELAERTEMVKRVRGAVMALSPDHREVIAWCDLEGLPYEEVAAILGCPVGTVRSRLYRARAQLATRLAELGEPAAASRVAAPCPPPGSDTSRPAPRLSEWGPSNDS